MMRQHTGAKTLIIVAMGLVSAATAAALYRHVGLPGPVAATAALATFLLLITLQTFAWRREGRTAEPAASAPSQRDRREQEVRRMKDDGRRAPPPGLGTPIPETPRVFRSASPPPLAGAPAQPPTRDPAGVNSPFAESIGAALREPSDRHEPAALRDPAELAHELAAPLARAAARAAAAPSLPPVTPPPMPELKSAPPPPPRAPQPTETREPPPLDTAGMGEMQDYWSFRPAAPRLDDPPFVTGRISTRPGEQTLPESRIATSAPSAPPSAPHQEAAPRQEDVEVIQDAIKRLLEEVNAAEQSDVPPQATRQPHAPFAGTPPPLPQMAPAAPSADAAIDHSVDALRMTHGAMQPHQAPQPQAAQPPPPLPPFVRTGARRPMSAADSHARQMADAISAGRIDVALEPILGLEDQQTRHYEVTVRLRDADGNTLEVSPNGPDLRGTGLLPLFDGVRIVRTAAVARRLDERGKGGSVFSSFSGESVADEHFLGELAETLHQRAALAAQLVLSFTQTDVRSFSTPEWDSLADMRALGFRFALSHITDLDMDFEALAEQGFVFAKLDASVFLEGLPAPSGLIPPSDVCRHLARHGLTLVVEHIDDDDKLARVFGFGVLLGQGQLFGGPRPVRADVAAGRASVAA